MLITEGTKVAELQKYNEMRIAHFPDHGSCKTKEKHNQI